MQGACHLSQVLAWKWLELDYLQLHYDIKMASRRERTHWEFSQICSLQILVTAGVQDHALCPSTSVPPASVTRPSPFLLVPRHRKHWEKTQNLGASGLVNHGCSSRRLSQRVHKTSPGGMAAVVSGSPQSRCTRVRCVAPGCPESWLPARVWTHFRLASSTFEDGSVTESLQVCLMRCQHKTKCKGIRVPHLHVDT